MKRKVCVGVWLCSVKLAAFGSGRIFMGSHKVEKYINFRVLTSLFSSELFYFK